MSYTILLGARLVGCNGRNLGTITINKLDSASLLYPYAPPGNKLSPNSIFNKFGSYGNQFNSMSAYNPVTTTPPSIVLNGTVIGYLTKNRALTGAIDPDSLFEWLGIPPINYS